MTLNARLVLWILLLLAGWQFVGSGQWWDRLVGMGLIALLAAVVWLDNKEEAPAQLRTEPQAGPDLMPWSLNLLDLLQQVLPVWGKQSLLVQQQTEDAIVHLNHQFADQRTAKSIGRSTTTAGGDDPGVGAQATGDDRAAGAGTAKPPADAGRNSATG